MSFSVRGLRFGHPLLLRGMLVLAALLLSGCTKQHLKSPVVGRGGSWSIEVEKVRSGPNRFEYQMVNYVPASGTRFLWVILRLSNVSDHEREFSWSSCNLDRGIVTISPSLVAVDTFVNMLKNENEDISAKDTVGRKVAFSYPKGDLPTRLKCGKIEIPLDL